MQKKFNHKDIILKNNLYYGNRISKYGKSIKSVNWGSTVSQSNRFKVIREIGIKENDFILDVGCGLGDFYKWTNAHNVKIKYEGIDISSKMIDMAKKHNNSGNFKNIDLLNLQVNNAYNYVIASGIFAHKYDNMLEYIETYLNKMFMLSKNGVCCNFLCDSRENKEDFEYYANTNEIMDLCKNLSKKYVLRHDYHNADFTIYIYK